MDIRQAAQVIRDTVDADTVVRLYGYTPKHGFIVCPFHGDTDASLKVYKGTGGWHCFGCGRGGSVIDFVMEHEGCNFQTAVRAVDNAAGLHLMDAREDPFKAEEQKRVQIWLDEYVAAIYRCLDAMKREIEIQLAIDLRKMKEIRGKDIQARTADEWTFLLAWADESQYNEYKIDKIDEFREEVAAWRRKARKVKSA